MIEKITNFVEDIDIFSGNKSNIILSGSYRNNRFLENYFNGKSDIDLINIINNPNDLNYDKIKSFTSEKIFNLFIDGKIDIINIKNRYGHGRNSMNLKIMKKEILEKIIEEKIISFKSYREEKIPESSKSIFYTNNLQIPSIKFDYKQSDFQDGFLINYFLKYKDDEKYIMADILSMLIFSSNLKKNSNFVNSVIDKIKYEFIKIIKESSSDEINNLLTYHKNQLLKIVTSDGNNYNLKI